MKGSHEVMNRVRIRQVRPSHWTDASLLKVPSYMARLTGMCLWGMVDDEGRAELRPDLIAGAAFPGDPAVTASDVETWMLMLDEAGFLTIYTANGSTWFELRRPLVTQRPTESEHPPPPVPESSGEFVAMGGARERARERVRAEGDERASRWAAWADEQERVAPPERPLLLDAPPIGCPEHPHNRFALDCGACGTARRRHDLWVTEQRYLRRVEQYERSVSDDIPW